MSNIDDEIHPNKDELITHLRSILTRDEQVMQEQARTIREQDKFIGQLREAVMNEGNRPDIHREQIARLRKEWPVLHDSIIRLVTYKHLLR